MKAIVGLGNIGSEYENTRHNVGFMALDRIARTHGFEPFTLQAKFEAEISSGLLAGEKVILIKPQTFMNNSGRAVQKVLGFYKLSPADLLVIHDDLDIPLGEYKIAFGRSSAGHKGVQSIIDFLSSKDFHRIRVGIKIENQNIPTEKFVLGNFNPNESATISSILDILPEAIEKELI